MSLNITISTSYDPSKTLTQQIDDAMAALGFVRKSSAVSLILGSDKPPASEGAEILEQAMARFIDRGMVEDRGCGTAPKGEPDTRGIMNVGLEHAEVSTRGLGVDYLDAKALAELTMPARDDAGIGHVPPRRKPGEPSPGHKRRTKAEMAEDEAYYAATAKLASTAEGSGEQIDAALTVLQHGQRQEEIPTDDADPQAAFAAASEDAETAVQDAADEAAEAATEQTGALTLEDLRRAIGDYAKKHGIPKAQANVPGILGAPMLEVTDFETAIARVRLATATSDGLLHESDVTPRATKDDLMEAIQAYAAKYEGKGVKPAAGGPTAVDLGKVMREAFPGTSGALSEIPATPEGYGKALGAVNAAITGNPFQREVK